VLASARGESPARGSRRLVGRSARLENSHYDINMAGRARSHGSLLVTISRRGGSLNLIASTRPRRGREPAVQTFFRGLRGKTPMHRSFGGRDLKIDREFGGLF